MPRRVQRSRRAQLPPRGAYALLVRCRTLPMAREVLSILVNAAPKHAWGIRARGLKDGPWRKSGWARRYMELQLLDALHQDIRVLSPPRLAYPATSAQMRGGAMGLRSDPVEAARNDHSTTMSRDAMASTPVANYLKNMDEIKVISPYGYDKPAVNLLNRLGIPATTGMSGVHPHPINKAIENMLLLRTAPSNIKLETTVWWMKDFKFEELKRLNPKITTLGNARITPRDFPRYAGTPMIEKVNTPCLFVHDALHFVTPEWVLGLFKENPTLEELQGTVILPAEVLKRRPSFYPSVYKLEYHRTTFSYILENNPADRYTQPYNDWWLKHSHLTDGKLTVTLERTQNFLGHHYFVIRRGDMDVPNILGVNLPEMVLLPKIGLLPKPEAMRLVPKGIYERAIHHARHLKKVGKNDAIAKIRSYQHEPEYDWADPRCWEYCSQFVIGSALLTPPELDVEGEINLPEWVSALKAAVHNRSWTWGLILGVAGLLALGLSLGFGIGFASTLGHAHLISSWLGCIFGWTSAACFSVASLVLPSNGQASHFWFSCGFITSLITLATSMGLGIGFAVHLFHVEAGFWAGQALSWASALISTVAVCCDLPSALTPGQRETRRLFMMYPEQYVWSLELTHWKGKGKFEIRQQKVVDPDEPVDEFPEYVPAPDAPEATFSGGVREPFARTDSCSYSPSTAPSDEGPIITELPDEPRPERPVPRILPAELPTPTPTPPPVPTPEVPPPIPQSPPPLHPEDFPSCAAEDEAPGGQGSVPLYEIFGITDPVLVRPDGASFRVDAVSPRWNSSMELPSGQCLIDAIHRTTEIPRPQILATFTKLSALCVINPHTLQGGFADVHLTAIAYELNLDVTVLDSCHDYRFGVVGGRPVTIYHSPGHWSYSKPSRVRKQRGKTERAQPGQMFGRKNDAGSARFIQAIMDWRAEDGSCIPIDGFRSHVVNPMRAKPLISDLNAGTSGIVFGPDAKTKMRPDAIARWKNLVDAKTQFKADGRRVNVATIYGYPGCGKSWPIAQVLRGSNHNFRVAVPTVDLRTDWKRMCPMKESENWRFGTYENSLLKNSEIVIIDEISMMPNGYVDLLLSLDPTVKTVIILGDVTQNNRHETNPSATCSALIPESEYWRDFSRFYLGYTRRLSTAVAERLMVPTFNRSRGFVGHSHSFPSGHVTITALTGDAASMNKLGIKTFTYPGSQGSTFEGPVALALDKSGILKCCNGAIHVALTRSRAGVTLVSGGLSAQLQSAMAIHPLWRAFAQGGTPSNWQSVFREELSGFTILSRPFMPADRRLRGGKRQEVPEDADVLVEHNFPLGYIPSYRRVGHSGLVEELPIDERPLELKAQEEAPRVHWASHDIRNLFNTIYRLRPVDSDSRLKLYEGEPSQQFADGEPEGLNPDGDYPEQIAARHRTSDPTLLPLSIPKRLRFASPEANRKELLSQEWVGQALFISYCNLMGLDRNTPIPFDDALFHSCIQYNEWHSLHVKTKQTILANAYKSDPDWRWSFIRLFMKQQRKVNDGSINGDWKAGQTISNMQDQWLLFFGPVIRYLRKLEHEYCPSHIYLHGGRNNGDLDEFCRKWLTPGTYYANDYTAFDQSQRGEVLASEVLRLKHASIPQLFIDIYVVNKTGMVCFLGRLQVMRFSGEPATYDFNCGCNLSITNLQFPLDENRHIAVLISGDDGGIGDVLTERDCWAAIRDHLSLRAKPEYQENRMLFVGYICTPKGCIRDPIPMLCRLYLARDQGKLANVLASYATEASTGYMMADYVMQYLDDFELDCFFTLIRTFHLENVEGRLQFRRDSMVVFVALAERCKGKILAGRRVPGSDRRDLVALYWRFDPEERSGLEVLTKELARMNIFKWHQ
uniref:Replication polyprotein n=1 Tax=Aulacomnium heterostichum associated tymo-like virus TaxID=2933119 RepID=A0A9C7GX49_9VIRU|nr:replication polyprotein [Aulacomnium heterostichum associated tymo-like virus]CAI5383964.1 replication polyprotein [Aulacomnium heterostichum associated tymo-like virus]